MQDLSRRGRPASLDVARDPVVLHVHHASTRIPADVRPTLLLSDEELRGELLRVTDWFTDDLFALPPHAAATVRFPVSRLVVDPERFLDDEREVMWRRCCGRSGRPKVAACPSRHPARQAAGKRARVEASS